MSSRRQQQVGEFLRVEISEIIHREMKDPRLGIASITRVDVSPDLRYAKALVSVLGTDDEQLDALKALNGASGFIRRTLKPRMRVRHVPEVSFHLDQSMVYAETMTKTLNEIKTELTSDADDQPPVGGNDE